MMNLKKIGLMTLTSATMLMPCTMGVLAETDSKSADVKYSVTEGYEWSIHSAIDFGSNAGVNQTVEKTGNVVSVTENVIETGKTLNISVAGSGTDGAFTIENKSGTATLNYHVLDGSTEKATGSTVLSVEAGTKTGSKDLTFKLDTSTGTSEVAGNYSGTVTYTATID